MQPETGLEIRAGRLRHALVLVFVPPRISIDGATPTRGRWGSNLLPVTPGSHTVALWWENGWFPRQANKAEITVDVARGQIVELLYRPVLFDGGLYPAFRPGRVQQVGVRTSGAD